MSNIQSAAKNLAEVSKTELFGKIQAMRRKAEASKQEMKHFAKVSAEGGLSLVAGVGAAVLDYKAETIGADGPRTDLVLGAAICAANAFGVLEEVGPYAGTVGNVLMGCGAKEYAKQHFAKSGWVKTNLLQLGK